MRRFAPFAVIAAFAVAGCALATKQAAVPPPGSAPGAVRPLDVISDSGGLLTVTGPISNVYSGGFTLAEGSGQGYVHVLTSAQTVVAGPAPFNGENVAVSGSGVPGGTITAASVSEQIVRPTGVLALSGPVSNASGNVFTIKDAVDGYTHVATNAQTQFVGGSPANGGYAQAVGPGTTSETATWVASWTSAPPPIVASGTIVAPATDGFTLNAGHGHPVTVFLGSSTTVSKWPMVVGGNATVTGSGSFETGIVATAVSVPSPAPTPTPPPPPTPTPNPNVTPVVLTEGGIIGRDNAFNPPDGDAPAGATGQTVDGMPCNTIMTTNQYHVHWYLGLLVNGVQMAIPDQIGMVNPGPIVNGFTATAQCYYDIHTHDASGMIHVEAISGAGPSASIYNVGNFFDVWGVGLGPNNVGPFSGQVRVFVDKVPLKGPVANEFVEFTGNPASIKIYSHEAIWLEVGPTFVLPANLPPVDFYTEY